MSAGLTTSSPSPDIVEVSLMNPVGSFGTSVSILLAASSSRCFLLFLPTQKNFEGSGIGARNFRPEVGRNNFSRSAEAASSSSAARLCGPPVSAALTDIAGTARCGAFAAATTSTMLSPRTMPKRASQSVTDRQTKQDAYSFSSRQLHV